MLAVAVKLIIIALSYAVVGKLALLLAIPPGYASAIFPPAGIALASLWLLGWRYWPAVFVGSLTLNIWVGGSQAELTATAVYFAVGVATGASLQALATFWSLQRWIGPCTTLTKDTDILKFMLLAGPVGCLINASIAVGLMLQLNMIQYNQASYSWFHWWVGDSIGVLIVTPMLFCLFAKPSHLWRSRRTNLAMPLLICLVGSIVLFVQASRLEQAQIETTFSGMVNETHAKLKAHLKTYTDTLQFIDRFFTHSDAVTAKEFAHFVDFTLAEKPGIQGFSWNEYVPHAQRAQFEQAMREAGAPQFKIKEKIAEQQWITAPERAEYVVVKFVEPLAKHAAAQGFNVYSDTSRRQTMDRARDSGEMQATARLLLVQDQSQNSGVLIFQPIYQGGVSDLKPRDKQLKGFAVGIFNLVAVFDAVLQTTYPDDILVEINDITDTAPTLLYGLSNTNAHSLDETMPLKIAGRTWTVRYTPTGQFFDKHHGMLAWSLLIIAFLSTCLLAAYLLSSSGRAYDIASVVERKTAELRGILSTALESIITLDNKGLIESINHAGEALFDYDADSLIGRPISLLIPELTATTFANKRHETMSHRVDSIGLQQGLQKIPIELAMSSFRLLDKLVHIVIVHDLTERNRVNQMKDEFISVISHELRTPLTSIKGVLGLLRSNTLQNKPEQQTQMINIAYDNCENLVRLVNDLLTFNKLSLAGEPLKISSINCSKLIERAVLSNQGFASTYQVHLHWQVEQDCLLDIDEDKILQVLSNLLSNAIKYSQAGQTVTVSTELTHSKLTIFVKDCGCGIPLEFQPHVFEKFAQADSSDTRRVGGTGLGMAISKSYVEQHHGSIGFDSTPGQGSTFFITLPLRQPSD